MDARRITPLCVRLLTAGHPPNQQASPTCWILLDLHAYVADRENATTAYCMMSNGEAVRVTFCVWCPNLPPSELVMQPSIQAAEEDLVHFCVSTRAQGLHFH